MKIDGAVAIVTGAARGIGRGYVEAMLEKGAMVGIKGIKGNPTEQTGKMHYGSFCAYFISVTMDDEKY